MLLRWAIGYSNEAKTHILSWAVQTHTPGAKTTPSLCGCDLPFGWLAFFEQQPDPHDFPPCRVCLNRARRRRSAPLLRAEAPSGRPPAAPAEKKTSDRGGHWGVAGLGEPDVLCELPSARGPVRAASQS